MSVNIEVWNEGQERFVLARTIDMPEAEPLIERALASEYSFARVFGTNPLEYVDEKGKPVELAYAVYTDHIGERQIICGANITDAQKHAKIFLESRQKLKSGYKTTIEIFTEKSTDDFCDNLAKTLLIHTLDFKIGEPSPVEYNPEEYQQGEFLYF